eukprot:CAMPEP_0198222296 /NCGR_PEP_ID=MMETSP1445-20131203/87488_1 /TAXON_ID=36898 /ORGANISM="Pyramimonas sp., Strain CCMP2087" /LENGTH=89 /DNA_ID=CAMNT_0043900745 /DNA_START=69 /DNA_END=335 /DNA_ORIENTATION=+
MIGACLLPLFREWNWRFDVIGGVLYFLLAVSAFPVCGIYHQFEGLSALETLKQVPFMFADVIGRIFSEAYLSLAVMLAVAAILITFVGA